MCKKTLATTIATIVSFILLASVVYAQPVQPAVIFKENWDVGQPTDGFPNTRGVSWNGWTTSASIEAERYHLESLPDRPIELYHK